jgi:hypothetical protein
MPTLFTTAKKEKNVAGQDLSPVLKIKLRNLQSPTQAARSRKM